MRTRLDLRRGLIMETRERQVSRIVVKIAQIVVGLDVSRLVFQRKR